jgi:hypothetical protein
MKFSIVFSSEEGEDLSIGCVFAPCILWKLGRRTLLNPHRQNPHYLKGDIEHFLNETGYSQRIPELERRVCVVVHPNGHGTDEYLQLLVTDLEEMHFSVTVAYL